VDMTLANPPLAPIAGASALAAILSRAMVVPLTVEQFQRMIEEGIVPEDSTVELLRGVMVRKDRSVIGEDPMGHSPLHVLVVSLLTALAARIDAAVGYMQIQLPVVCPPDGAPEPDAAIVRGAPRNYVERMITAQDVSCVIEVAHSSLDRDREDKLAMYAAAGIGQYVIVNLQNMTIEVYEEPDRAGEQYRTRATLERGETVGLKLPSGAVFEVAAVEILP
jgi:Uma2 family endonuclease